MKIKELIKELQKLDGEKTIGSYDRMDEVSSVILIEKVKEFDRNDENLDYVIY